jgi:hypothetical protein
MWLYIMVAAKCKAGDENTPPMFSDHDLSGPYVKHVFKSECKVDLLDIQNQHVANEANMAEAWKAAEEAAANGLRYK